MTSPRYVRAVYPGTFDPLTRGHEDLVRRATALFSEIIVAVARSHSKNPLFSLDERVAIAEEALADLPSVRVVGFDGLLVDFLHRMNARVILRGLRAVSDFEYEFQMAGMNRKLNPEVETIFLPPADEFMFLSGTMVREIARLGGDVSRFVVPAAIPYLMRRFSQPQ